MNPKVHHSVVLEKLRAGKTAVCYKTNLACSRTVQIPAILGFDCVWLCQEHVPNNMETVENQITACKAFGTDTMVRVAKGSYNDFIKPLESDATGIMVPHLMSAKEARDIVHWTRFSPVGLRPIDGGNADGLFCNLGLEDYVKMANEDRFVVTQIEDIEPLDELEEICATPGIDIIFFGPADFSHSAGVLGDFNNPKVLAAKKRVAETARKYGKFAGTTMGPGDFQKNIDLGYTFLCCGADVLAISENCKNILEAYNKVAL